MPDDDPKAIPNETRLFRRINPIWTVYDSNRNERRPGSQNFQNSRDGSPMSVFAENIAIAHGEAPAGFLRGRWAEWYIAAVPAGWMRENGQKVYPDPQNQDPDDMFASHGAVEGPKGEKARKRLGDKYEWVVPPPNRFDR